jgi:hypothetical protein
MSAPTEALRPYWAHLSGYIVQYDGGPPAVKLDQAL